MDASPRPLVFVSIGTDHHPFPRLLDMVVAWAGDRGDVDVLAQTGHTPPPAGLEAVAFMVADELTETFARADAVVCHGGPSTIMEARATGHLPVVVARDPGRGEHVDTHQLRFVERIAGDGIVLAARSPETLAAALGRVLASGPTRGPRPDRPEAVAAIDTIGSLLDGLIEPHPSPTLRRAR